MRLLHGQGTFGVLVTYTLLCGRVVLHALSAYQRVRHGESPRPSARVKGGGGDVGTSAPPTRGCLLVRSWFWFHGEEGGGERDSANPSGHHHGVLPWVAVRSGPWPWCMAYQDCRALIGDGTSAGGRPAGERGAAAAGVVHARGHAVPPGRLARPRLVPAHRAAGAAGHRAAARPAGACRAHRLRGQLAAGGRRGARLPLPRGAECERLMRAPL